jgi:hypothetical protein
VTVFIKQPGGIAVARQALDLYPQGFGSFLGGLSYFRLFDSFSATPQFFYPASTAYKSEWADSPVGAVQIACGPGGSCLNGTTTGSAFGLTNNNAFQPEHVVGGTFLAYVRANFSPTDGVQHLLFNVGNAGTFYAMNKAASNTWKIGWFDGATEYRASTSSTGTYTAGDVFVVGGTYIVGTKLQTTWVKGKKIAADNSGGGNANIVTASLTGGGASFLIGNQTVTPPTVATNSWWQTDSGNQIYWVAFWDVALSDDVIAYISANPTTWMVVPDYFQSFGLPSIGKLISTNQSINRASTF